MSPTWRPWRYCDDIEELIVNDHEPNVQTCRAWREVDRGMNAA
jgi:hypothetical protein